MTDRTHCYKCPVCSFSLWYPISRLKVSALGLYNDARFPGRCILILDKHVEDFAAIDPDLAQAFVLDAQIAARAIRTVTEAPRINYAILGNQVPHLHFHLVPRGHPDDPIPTRPPWEHPIKKVDLPAADTQRLIEGIRLSLYQVADHPSSVGVKS